MKVFQEKHSFFFLIVFLAIRKKKLNKNTRNWISLLSFFFLIVFFVVRKKETEFHNQRMWCKAIPTTFFGFEKRKLLNIGCI